jgi:hypothetical protein
MKFYRSAATCASLAITFSLLGCESDPKSEMKESSTYKGGTVLERVANKTIGDMKKELELPLEITDQIEITEIKAKTSYKNQNQKTIQWQAKFNNKSDLEVVANINVCESDNATFKSEYGANNHYYLVDCKNINLRYNPTAQTTNHITFAESYPWNNAQEKMGRLCIKDVGCTSRFIPKY